MRKFATVGSLALLVCVVGAVGCAKSHKPADPASLQGTWKSPVARGDQQPNTLVLQGNTLDFHAGNGQEWYKGTFVLQDDTNPKRMIVTITDCPLPQYVGKTANAIYEVNNGTLVIAANEPGNPATPARFGMPGVAQLTLKLQ